MARRGALAVRPVTSVRAALGSSSLVRNSGFLMSTTVLTAGLGYVYWVIAAHGYSAKAVGLATALIAGQALVSMLCCIGIDAALIQMLPATTDDGAWSALVNAGLATGVAASAVVSTGVAFALPAISGHYSILHQPAVLALFIAGGALGTAGIITDATFVSARRSGNMLARNVVLSSVKLPLMAVPALLLAHPGVSQIMLSWVVAIALSLLIGIRVQMPRVRSGYSLHTWSGFRTLIEARANVGAHFLTNVGSQLPQFVLPIIVVVALSAQDNAYFYLAWSVGGIFLFVSPAVAQSLFAEGSNFEDLRVNARRSVALTSALLAPLILGALIFAHQILSIFGPAYAAHGTVLLRIIALSAIPDSVTNIYIAVARVDGRIGRAAALNVLMAVLAVGLAVPMIDAVGLPGPAWSWLIAQSVGTFLVLRSVSTIVRGSGRHTMRSGLRPGSRVEAPAAPGWHPDPMSGAGWYRYWNGTAWTGDAQWYQEPPPDVGEGARPFEPHAAPHAAEHAAEHAGQHAGQRSAQHAARHAATPEGKGASWKRPA